MSFHVYYLLLIRIPLNSKQKLADEWLRINQTQPVLKVIPIADPETSERGCKKHEI